MVSECQWESTLRSPPLDSLKGVNVLLEVRGGGGTEACYLEAYRDDCYDLSRVWVMRKSSYLSGSDEKEGICKIF